MNLEDIKNNITTRCSSSASKTKELSARISADIDAFLKRGGKIKKLRAGESSVSYVIISKQPDGTLKNDYQSRIDKQKKILRASSMNYSMHREQFFLQAQSVLEINYLINR